MHRLDGLGFLRISKSTFVEVINIKILGKFMKIISNYKTAKIT